MSDSESQPSVQATQPSVLVSPGIDDATTARRRNGRNNASWKIGYNGKHGGQLEGMETDVD